MLERFGFTPTEARVYEALLSLGPSTGYVVAREISVARANVYQALESLHRRQAVRKASTSPVQYTAVGPAALLAELERSFRADLGDLEEALRSLPLATASAIQLEQIKTADQLVARATAAVDGARNELFAVTGPWASSLNARIAAAGARRVQLRVVSLGAPSPDGAVERVVADQALREYWGGQPLAVVADQGRAVCGVLDAGAASGIATTMPGLIPWFRHIIRRELAHTADRT